jgi:hypothetical protein
LLRALAACVSIALLLALAAPADATHDTNLGVFADMSFLVPFTPANDTIATDVGMYDFDLDGDLDLFVTLGDLAGGARTVKLFRNNGSGTFSAGTTLGAAGRKGSGGLADFADVEFGDANGDGRQDLLLSVNLGIERLMLLTTGSTSKNGTAGSVGFSDRTTLLLPPNQPADVTIESRFFDSDGDGDLDIITANEDPFRGLGAQNRLYLNDGTGRFTDATANLPAMLDQSSAFAIGDFDGDGDQDVITVNNGPFVYLQNDGTGHFTDESLSHVPLGQSPTRDSGRDAVVADLEGDLDLDVIFAISRSDEGPLLWRNNGLGVFTDESSTNVPLASRSAQGVEGCDLEGDGDLDIIEANSGAVLFPPTDHKFAGAQDRILVNDGLGFFTDVTEGHLPPVVDSTFFIACGDITGDGRLDLVAANGKGEPLRVYVQGAPPAP